MTIYLPQISHFVNLKKQAEQIQNLLNINHSTYHQNPYYVEWFKNEYSIENIQHKITTQPTYFVIENQTEIIGVSTINPNTGETQTQIHKHHQSKGHGRILLNKTLPHHPTPHTLTPATDKKTITVYQRKGFQTTQTLTHPIYGETIQLTLKQH